MLTLPLVTQLIVFLHLLILGAFWGAPKPQPLLIKSPKSESAALKKKEEQLTAGLFAREVLTKTVMSTLFFYFVYGLNNSWLNSRYKYDPSGHMLCSIVSYCNWAALCNLLSKHKYVLQLPIGCIALALTVYQLYCTFWTCFIFHTPSEGILGTFYGIEITTLVFNTDLVSGSLGGIVKRLGASIFG